MFVKPLNFEKKTLTVRENSDSVDFYDMVSLLG